MTFVVGSHVWVEKPESVWIDGEVLNIKGDDAEIQTSDGNKVMQLLLFSFCHKSCYYFKSESFGLIHLSLNPTFF